MAAEKVEIVLDGKDAGLVRAWLAGRDSVAAYEAGLKKLEPATRENAKAAADFERAAKQAYEATRTPLEKFNREQEKLDDLFATGLIDIQTYNRALQQQKQILEQSDAALQARLAAEKEQASLAARVIASLITPQERYAQKLKELKTLTDSGKLSTDQFAAAVAREKAALDAADESLQKQKRDQEQLGASAKRVIDSLLTPQERYNQKLVELNRLLAAGALNQQQYARAADAAKKELDNSGKATGRLTSSLTGLAAGWLSVGAAVGGFLSHNQKVIDQANKEADVLDDIIRKYSIIAGIRGLDSEEAKTSILKAAYDTATTKEDAGKAAQELVSAGMESKEVQGGGLRSFLEIVNAAASNGRGADYGTMASSIVQYLNSQGLDATGENLRKYGVQMQRLAGPTKLSFTNVPDLAKVSAGFKGLLTPEEQISTFGTMTNVMQGSEAATAMKGVVKNLSIIGGKKDAQPYLKMMGVKPEDIDLAADKNGQNKENFDTVLGRLQEGLARIPESKRAEALAKIVEGDNIAPLQFLMANRDKLKENIAKQSDVAGFENDVRTAQSGRGAAGRRLQLKEEIQLAEQAGKSQLYLTALRTTMRDRGESEARIALAEKTFQTAQNFGADEEWSLWGAGAGGEEGRMQKELTREAVRKAEDPAAFLKEQQELARQMLEESRKTNRLLEENNKKPPVKVVPKDNRQPPAPVPAAALGGPQ